MDASAIKICVVGLGYVGLPLAKLFATKYAVVGFDVNKQRVQELQKVIDSTKEVDEVLLKKELHHINASANLVVTHDLSEVTDANFYIITVPTPIDKFNRPDLSPLELASKAIGAKLKKGDYVVYESTVYPGVTEEVCVPLLEEFSGLKFNEDFYVGYSPERINPGDKERTVEKILKITSGSSTAAATFIDALYASVIEAGTFKATSIKVAEAAKVIENAQRDINIAFVNELAKIFNVLGIDTHDVLAAAGTKWNFLKFQPGLVGGHCIGVDPFYLAEKAKIHGYYPELIFASRRLNDSMGGYVAEQIVKAMIHQDIKIKGAKVLILGIAFKENCPDIRNSKVIDVFSCLRDYGVDVTVYDPIVAKAETLKEYGIAIVTQQQELLQYDAVVLAVAHDVFYNLSFDALKQENAIVYDVKGVLGDKADYRL